MGSSWSDPTLAEVGEDPGGVGEDDAGPLRWDFDWEEVCEEVSPREAEVDSG